MPKNLSQGHKTLPRIMVWLIFLLGLVTSTLLFVFYLVLKVNIGLLSLQPLWLSAIVGIILLVMGALTVGLAQISRFLDNQTVLNRTNKFGILGLFILSLSSVVFFGNVLWAMFYPQPPDFFPFDDRDATYTIAKPEDFYVLEYRSTGNMNAREVCEPSGYGKTYCQTRVEQNIDVMIGKSDVQLEPLVGKNVIVDGDFAYADQQCNVDVCQQISRMAVVHITSAREQ